ncbi:RNA-binding protein 4B [Plecturocebus cupreus]
MVKLFIGNLPWEATEQEIQSLFKQYGEDYAFVHMERSEDAVETIRGLDNTVFQGKIMHVQLSTSRLQTAPGMGDQSGCCQCKKEGHWSKECPVDRVADFTEQYNVQYGAVYTPYTMGYWESRHLLPNSDTAATSAAMAASAATISSYCRKDRSTLRHATVMLPIVREGYGYGSESELSQASAATQNSLYDMAQYEWEQYVDRAWYSAF